MQRAIESVLCQTHPVDEIIVVNDCSPEESEIEKVLAAYPAVVYLKNPVNIGLAATRNKGAMIASGDILTFLDADDELHPEKIEQQLKFVNRNTAVTTHVCRVYPNKNVSAELPNDTGVIVVNGVGRMLIGNYLTGASMMIHKELFSALDGYDSNLRSCEDFDLWLRLLERGVNVINIPRPLYIYHYNQQGLSKNYLDISYWELEVLKNYFARNNLSLEGSLKAALIWSVWMVKHLLRCESGANHQLELITCKNVDLLSTHPVLKGLIKGLSMLRIIKLCALIMKKK